MNLGYIIIATFMAIAIIGMIYALYNNSENPTVYLKVNGTVIDIKDTWNGRYAIVELDNGKRIEDHCRVCLLDDSVTVKFFESGNPMNIKILEK